jgi:tetratricopeptide (TPR) repeat protein
MATSDSSMATSRSLLLSFILAAAAAQSHEAASPSACQTAAAQPAMENAKAALERNPSDLRRRFALADAWSDAGCFSDALQVLQSAGAAQQGNRELETRLRVAKSLVGEEHFFDDLDRASGAAKLKRDTFRCTSLGDLDACNEAVSMSPEDPALLIADGDALARAKRPADALSRYRRAATLVPDKAEVDTKINAAEAELPAAHPDVAMVAGRARHQAVAGAARPSSAANLQIAQSNAAATPIRRYSNAAPETRSH